MIGQIPIPKTAFFKNGTIDYLYQSAGSFNTTISKLTINNTAFTDYTIYIYIRSVSLNQEWLLYKIILSAGDFAFDTDIKLTPDTELRGYATVSTAIYSIQGYKENI